MGGQPGFSETPLQLLAYPLDGDGNPNGEPIMFYSQPIPSACDADNLLAAPNGRFLTIQYNCHADEFARLLALDTIFTPGATHSDLSTIPADPTRPAKPELVLPRGYFLDWSPDGQWLLFRNTDHDQITLLTADGTTQTTLVDLPFGSYGAAFHPSGQHLLIAATRGLGFGSELGILDLRQGIYTPLTHFPDQIVAYPRWSPDGSSLVYLLMPDSNVPYPVGELWLADAATGKPLTLLGPADAGHGYPPMWSPNGRTIAYVHRENPDSVRADQLAAALHSNLYLADSATGETRPLTHFSESLVYDPVWSPDGTQIAFTANDAVWLVHPEGGEPLQLTSGLIARHPTWFVTSLQP